MELKEISSNPMMSTRNGLSVLPVRSGSRHRDEMITLYCLSVIFSLGINSCTLLDAIALNNVNVLLSDKMLNISEVLTILSHAFFNQPEDVDVQTVVDFRILNAHLYDFETKNI